ncbi:BQ5605_C007g04775 [Microbotryum silenes-dioicae]|uniref:BQ5605_C007g04775 protein n=1 Tax=Microbotryum silenes-dioicae TaxID=796604 RepID=A0A2X0MCD0_9BASI|nr:BQ5605_C007g04775 [Microbotryum silenes-dioicae]
MLPLWCPSRRGPLQFSLFCRDPNWFEVCMLHRLLRRQPFLVIVPQQLVKEVDRLVRDEALVLRGDET